MSTDNPCDLFAPRSVLVPTDSSLASRTAFAHALAFSLIGEADLTIFDASPPSRCNGSRPRTAPGVRNTLRRWGVLPADDWARQSLGDLGLRVKRVNPPDNDLLGALAHEVCREPAELLVLGVSESDGAPAWLTSGYSDLPTLPLASVMLVPPRARGFVALRDGALSLRQIVVIVDQSPDPAPAFDVAARIVRSFSDSTALCRVLHIGGNATVTRAFYPNIGDMRWDGEQVIASDPDALAAASEEADLVVMPIAARDGKDMFAPIRGGFAGQLAQRCRCPLLLIPSHTRPVLVDAVAAQR